jgi:hypothetical protein
MSVFTSVLQFEVPGGEVRSHRLPDKSSFVEALKVCRDDARTFHNGDLQLVSDPLCRTQTERTYKVIVNGKVDETEWYVIEEVK